MALKIGCESLVSFTLCVSKLFSTIEGRPLINNTSLKLLWRNSHSGRVKSQLVRFSLNEGLEVKSANKLIRL